MYQIIYLDCIHVKVLDSGVVKAKSVYLAIGIDMTGNKEVVAALKSVYAYATVEHASQALNEFETGWGRDYPSIVQSWRRNWQRIIPFIDYPPEIRKVIYTTNAIESVNMRLRKITKNRGSFPSDEALSKLFYLALKNISKKWNMLIRD